METTVEVTEKSQVAEVRRVVAEMGKAMGMPDADLGRAALVATEASTNLVKYGKQGTVSVGRFVEPGGRGLQIVATDRGPGFANFLASARDGHSTGGSLGVGLGAIQRMSDLFEVYTVETQGSALLFRIAAGGILAPLAPGALSVGTRRRPMRGEHECGDAWASASSGRWQWLGVIDGLGHGPLAAVAAAEAAAVVRGAGDGDSPVDILARAHEAMRSTRGAVMAVVAIDTAAGKFRFSGVGNIAAMLCDGESATHLLSVEGVVGYNARNMKLREAAWTRNCALILSTDGLSSRGNPLRYPGLLERHPGLVAAVLFRDFARDTDDATVLVAKEAP